jgi:hypothetical protein
LAPNFIVTITKEADKLMGEPTGQQKTELQPISETEFIVPSVKANVTFEKDATGKVIGLILVQNGQTIKGKKIK